MRIRGILKKNAKYKVDIRRHCEDPSHIMSCPQSAAERSGQTLYHPDGDFNLLVERPMPELRVNRGSIWLSWTAHLAEKSYGKPLTDLDLRSRINEVRENCGRYLCPVTIPTQDVPEMRCFDPNECNCASFRGRQNVKWPLGSSLHPNHKLLYHARGPVSIPTSALKIHMARLDFDTRFVPGTSDPKFWLCPAGDGCLVLDYTRRVRFERGGAIDLQWYHALDPDSYSLTEDEEGFGIYWCRQKECRNYSGRFPGFSRIIRMADYHRSVDARNADAKTMDAQ